ncbi:hypothetical protein FRB96_002539 [Tulasnella sp. 330]|nr:hypothetical protein FRB96_002539 [Tulasnella sp. 330]
MVDTVRFGFEHAEASADVAKNTQRIANAAKNGKAVKAVPSKSLETSLRILRSKLTKNPGDARSAKVLGDYAIAKVKEGGIAGTDKDSLDLLNNKFASGKLSDVDRKVVREAAIQDVSKSPGANAHPTSLAILRSEPENGDSRNALYRHAVGDVWENGVKADAVSAELVRSKSPKTPQEVHLLNTYDALKDVTSRGMKADPKSIALLRLNPEHPASVEALHTAATQDLKENHLMAVPESIALIRTKGDEESKKLIATVDNAALKDVKTDPLNAKKESVAILRSKPSDPETTEALANYAMKDVGNNKVMADPASIALLRTHSDDTSKALVADVDKAALEDVQKNGVAAKKQSVAILRSQPSKDPASPTSTALLDHAKADVMTNTAKADKESVALLRSTPNDDASIKALDAHATADVAANGMNADDESLALVGARTDPESQKLIQGATTKAITSVRDKGLVGPNRATEKEIKQVHKQANEDLAVNQSNQKDVETPAISALNRSANGQVTSTQVQRDVYAKGQGWKDGDVGPEGAKVLKKYLGTEESGPFAIKRPTFVPSGDDNPWSAGGRH